MPNDWSQRVMELPKRHSNAFKTAVFFAVLAIAIVVATFYDRTPRLSHLQVKFLSGHPKGNYYTIVNRLVAEARRRHGHIENLPSAGSVENIARLVTGEAQFALVQDGLDWPEGHHLELIGRLGTPESFVLLGRNADRIHTLSDLQGMRVGIGPVGGGTEHVVRYILAQLPELNLQISTPNVEEQFAQLQSGELDLAAMVIDEDAQILVDAVRNRHLQIVDMAGTEVLSHRLPFARAGVIPAGNYDPVRQLPPQDKHVLQIDTLVISNGRASWSATQGLITVLTTQFPDFVHLNRTQANRTGLPLASAASSYFESSGPDVVGVYAPWVVDLMPTARWIQLVFAFSILINVMSFLNRFRLWRINAARVKLESELRILFAPGMTVGEIATVEPEERQRAPEMRTAIDNLIEHLSALLTRCRRQSLSVIVPLGQEMSYRYQELLILDLLRSLSQFRAKLVAVRPLEGDAPSAPNSPW